MNTAIFMKSLALYLPENNSVLSGQDNQKTKPNCNLFWWHHIYHVSHYLVCPDCISNKCSYQVISIQIIYRLLIRNSQHILCFHGSSNKGLIKLRSNFLAFNYWFPVRQQLPAFSLYNYLAYNCYTYHCLIQNFQPKATFDNAIFCSTSCFPVITRNCFDYSVALCVDTAENALASTASSVCSSSCSPWCHPRCLLPYDRDLFVVLLVKCLTSGLILYCNINET